jgi:hypothetical protein
MPASTSRSAASLAAATLLVLLAAGCAGKSTTSNAASQPGTTSTVAATTTVAPTTTTLPPLTAKDLAWLKAIPTVSKKIDKILNATSNMTISAMRKLAGSLRSCSRELVRGAPHSDRLQPVLALVKKACKEYDKGAVCFATAARIGIPYGGSPQDRAQTKAIQCGYDAGGKGSIILLDAENKGEEIKAEVG